MWVADVSRARTSVDAVFNVLTYFLEGCVHADGVICIAAVGADFGGFDDGFSFAIYLALYRTYH